MQFQIRSFQPSTGKVIDSLVDQDNEDIARQHLEAQGLTVLSVKVQGARRGPKRSNRFNVGLFCEELRTLLLSGMSLVEAIDTLCSKGNINGGHPVLLGIKLSLQEGKSFSTALTLSSFPFPTLLIASVKASERTSLIDKALDEYISYDRIGRELSKKIISAAIYPALVIGFGLLVSFFMISYVVPRFAKIYDDFTPSLSFATIALMKFGQFMGDHLLMILTAAGSICAALYFSYQRGTLQRWSLDLLRNFTFARHYLRIYQLARIFQTLSMLLKGGYTLPDAIPLAQNLAFDTGLHSQIASMHQQVMEGKRMSTAFTDNDLTDSVTERLLQVGERSGDLPKILDIIAMEYRQEFTRFVENTTRLAEPILLMVVGVMIGAIIVLMYMPVFDLAGGM